MRALKIGLIISLVSISVGVVATHHSGTLFPLWSFIMFLLTIGLVLVGYYFKPDLTSILVPILLVGVTIRAYQFYFPASFIGLDPDQFALQISRVIQQSELTVDVFFYSSAPLSQALGAIVAITLGVSIRVTLGVYPAVIGMLVPLITILFIRRIYGPSASLAVIISGVISAVATISVHYAFWPNPQTYAVALVMVSTYVYANYYETERHQYLWIFLLLSFTMVFAHKLPLIVVVATIALLSVIYVYSVGRKPVGLSDPRTITIVASLTIVAAIAFIQLSFVTNFFAGSIIRILRVFSIGGLSSAPGDIYASAAVKPGVGINRLIARRIHGFVLIPIAGISWFYLLIYRDQSYRIQVLLAASAASVTILGASILQPTSAPPLRTFFFAEFLLVILVGVFVAIHLQFFINDIGIARIEEYSGILTIGLTIFILSTQLFAVPAVPDYPETPRYYLEPAEISGKQFGHSRINEPIYTDPYAAGEIIPSRIEQGLSSGSYRPLPQKTLLNGTIKELNKRYIAIRPEEDVLWTPYGKWQLTWSPEQKFDHNANRIYESGDFVIYRSETISIYANQSTLAVDNH